MQKQLGVDQPDYGVLFADMDFSSGDELPVARTQQPRAEAEVAIVLERDLTQEHPSHADSLFAAA